MPRWAMALVTPRLVESKKIKLRTIIGAPGIPTQHTPPPVFCKKSPQTFENKRGRRKKEGQERTRGRKPFMAKDFSERPNTEGTEVGYIEGSEEKTRGATQIDVKTKELSKKGFR